MSVAFEAQGEIVPIRGTTTHSAPGVVGRSAEAAGP